MYLFVYRTVEINPREKVEYTFRYDLNRRKLTLDRVTKWTRRSKVATSWDGADLPTREAPTEVHDAALAEAQDRTSKI